MRGRDPSRAFLYTRSADLGLYVAVFMLIGSAGTSEIAAALESADLAIVFGSTICGEGRDRIDLTLEVPSGWNRVLKRSDLQGQDAFLTAVGTAAKAAGVPSVGAVVTPGPLLTPWSSVLDALLVSFMPGQEYGGALIDVLFGTVNPSGRLPVTLCVPSLDTVCAGASLAAFAEV